MEEAYNSVLERRCRIIQVQESKTDDERNRDVIEETSEAIIGRAVEGRESTAADSAKLMEERSSICSMDRDQLDFKFDARSTSDDLQSPRFLSPDSFASVPCRLRSAISSLTFAN